jgi:cytochrome c2
MKTSLAAILALAVVGASAMSAAAADPARGERLWRKCASCHTLEANGRNRAGPRLHGVFGRTAGSVPDYRYSEALKRSGIVWTAQTLDAYIKDSEGFVPGTPTCWLSSRPQPAAEGSKRLKTRRLSIK